MPRVAQSADAPQPTAVPAAPVTGSGSGLIATTPGTSGSSGLVTRSNNGPAPGGSSGLSTLRATPNGRTTPEVAGSDFVVLEAPRPTTVGIVFARDGDGKTYLCTNFCPEPVVVIGLDGRGEHEIKKALLRGRKVYYLDAAMPGNISMMSHEEAQAAGDATLKLITRNYEWAVEKSIREWGRGTLVVDTSTELRDIVRVSVRGRVDRPHPKTGEKGDFGKSDAVINRTLKYFSDRARNSNLNLVLLSRAKPIYDGHEDTGRVTWDTDKIFLQAADWVVEYRMVGGNLAVAGPMQLLGATSVASGPSFEIQVTKPKLNIAELGKVYRQHEWDEGNPFVHLCTRVVPNSRPEDWR